MSKLEELIARLCPDGVEYKSLGEVATISRGGNFQKKDFVEQGKPCIHYGQIYTKYGLFADKTFTFIDEGCFAKQKKAQKNDIVMAVTSENIEDVCKCLAWIGDDEVAVSGHSAIIHHTLDPKYLTYFFHSEHFFKQKKKFAHGTKVIEVTPDKLTSIKLPVPPLEVQREIVHILDSYTTSNNELKEQLEKELAARQKQYEFYRDVLLTFKNIDYTILNERTNELELSGIVRWMKLGDLCRKVVSGGTPTASRSDYYNGVIPWLRTQEVDWKYIYDTGVKITQEGYNNSSAKWIPKNCVIVAMYGATAAKTAINKIPLTTNQACCNLEIDDNKASYKYVYYWLCKEYLALKALGQGSQNNINANIVKNYPIPVPPLSEQQRIVDILDRFDALCNDITNGLPAEIEARKKQYEYYRDKLLTFKELKKEA